MFAQRGIEIADADVVARALVEPGQSALGEIAARFGEGALLADGSLDRAALRRRIFDDAAARRDLETILHPRIRTALRAACAAATSAYAIAAIPLLAESGGRTTYPWLSRILVVDCTREIQIRRLLARDGGSVEQAAAMLAAQATREARLAIADDVIENSGDLGALMAQVQMLDTMYRRHALA